MSRRLPIVVLGGTGYVAGEVVRLVVQHPGFELAAVVSESRAGLPVAEQFPHLAPVVEGLRFVAPTELEGHFAAAARKEPEGAEIALVSAAPHGASAAAVARAIELAERRAVRLSVVDLSADFRFADAATYAEVYGHPHAAPELLRSFVRAVPEHVPSERSLPRTPRGGVYVAHPGCFTTAALLAVVPLLAEGIAEPDFAITAITGSTGSGRTLTEKTHHPERRSNVAAYSPLAHRHAPEMATLAALATGRPATDLPTIAFVPLSGPQARGIYATMHARLARDWRQAGAAAIAERCAAYYSESPFVAVSTEPPALTEVVGTHRARIGVAAAGPALAVTVAIDNLVKGAAGGAVQWLNRIYGLPETAGLLAPGLGWF